MKYFGKIGFEFEEQETSPGIWEPTIIEKEYYGEITRMSSRWNSSSEKVNDDLTVNNELSILSDPWMQENFSRIKYIWWGGSQWSVSSIDVQFPRLVLQIGGLYSGKNKVNPTSDPMRSPWQQ